MAGTVAAIIAEASKHIGYHEGRDKNGNWNNKQKFGEWYARQIHNPAFAAVAWCDIFISYVASVTGSGDIIPLSAYVPSRLNYYRARKLTGHFPPQPGDLGFVLVNGRAVHIFLVKAWDAAKSQVVTIEGNTSNTGSPQGDGVYSLRRKDSPTNANLVYARPAYAKPAAPKPVVKPAPAPAPAKPALDVVKKRLDTLTTELAALRKDLKK